MTLGIENKKKTAVLGGLILVMLYMVYTNLLSGPSIPAGNSQPRNSAAEIERAADTPRSTTATGGAARAPVAAKARNEEFHPMLRSKREEQHIDPLTVDPTLHLDLLAKLQDVKPQSGGRNLFQFGAPPPPPQAKTPPKPVGPEPKIDLGRASAPNMPVQPPPPPPPPFKYYGLAIVRATGTRKAYILDGDEIVLAPEGAMLKKRYRVVRIAPDSVMLEDTQLNRQQSIRISEDVNAPA